MWNGIKMNVFLKWEWKKTLLLMEWSVWRQSRAAVELNKFNSWSFHSTNGPLHSIPKNWTTALRHLFHSIPLITSHSHAITAKRAESMDWFVIYELMREEWGRAKRGRLGRKHITFHSVIKENNYYFLYEGSKRKQLFAPLIPQTVCFLLIY